jgi:1,2-diacylglycerol 3-alpha-glucosyltransferase
MRILIAGQTYYPAFNGQSIFMTNLAEGLVQRGHDVLVVVPSNVGHAYQTEIHDVPIQAIKSVQLNFLHQGVFYTPLPGKAIRRIVKDFNPDIVHIHDHYPISRAVVQAAKRSGIKMVGTNHFMPENLMPYLPFPDGMKQGFRWLLWQWMLELYNRLDVATAPSRTAAAILRRQGLVKPVYPISCGVDPERFCVQADIDRSAWRQRYGLDPDKILFLFVGRVDGEKRLDVLIRALSYLQNDHLQLGIVGKGAAMDKLKALAVQLGVGNQVRFTGFVPDEDLPSLLNSADIFAMPSEAELLSIASLEAMSCGRPVLAAHARALPELVNEGVNGYLFQPGNAHDAARYMALLAEHSARWPSMGTASLEKARLHSLDRTLQRYEKVYDTVSEKAAYPSQQTSSKTRRRVKRKIRESIDQL